MFNIKVNIYAICLIIALLFNVIFIIFSAKKTLPNYMIVALIALENVGIIYGAKILAFFQNYDLYNGNFNVFKIGFSAYGGLIGAIVMVGLFSYIVKIPFKDLIHITLPPVPLMYAIGKIGCFLSGCCYGIEYSGIGHIIYNYSPLNNNHITLFPVQLVEAIVFFFIFIYIAYRYNKYAYEMKNISLIFILCSLFKFILYYLRMEHINSIFSSGQLLCILFFLIGIIVYIVSDKKEKNINNKL